MFLQRFFCAGFSSFSSSFLAACGSTAAMREGGARGGWHTQHWARAHVGGMHARDVSKESMCALLVHSERAGPPRC